MFELRIYEEKVVEEAEREPPQVELDLVAVFSCNSIGECINKLAEVYEAEQEAVVIEEETNKEVLKVAEGKLVYVDKRFIRDVLKQMPHEFLEPDPDEARICRELSVERDGIKTVNIEGIEFYDLDELLISKDCRLVLRLNWP